MSSKKKPEVRTCAPAPKPAGDAPEVRGVMDVADLRPSPTNPRKTFPEEGLAQLAASLKEHGVLQPLLVRPMGEKGRWEGGDWAEVEHFQVVAGERRLRAAKLAGVKKVPVVVRFLSDVEALEIQLIENDQREDVKPSEQAAAYARLVAAGKTIEDVVAVTGKPVAFVRSVLALAKLPAWAQGAVDSGALPRRTAEAVTRIPDEAKREQVAAMAVAGSRRPVDAPTLKKLQAGKVPTDAEPLTYRAVGEIVAKAKPKKKPADRSRPAANGKPPKPGGVQDWQITDRAALVAALKCRDMLLANAESLEEMGKQGGPDTDAAFQALSFVARVLVRQAAEQAANGDVDQLVVLNAYFKVPESRYALPANEKLVDAAIDDMTPAQLVGFLLAQTSHWVLSHSLLARNLPLGKGLIDYADTTWDECLKQAKAELSVKADPETKTEPGIDEPFAKPGDIVRTNYGTGPYTVKEITKQGKRGGRPKYSLVLRDWGNEKKSTDSWINDCQRQPDGRITCTNSKDELIVLPAGSDGGPTYWDWLKAAGLSDVDEEDRNPLQRRWMLGEPPPAKPATNGKASEPAYVCEANKKQLGGGKLGKAAKKPPVAKSLGLPSAPEEWLAKHQPVTQPVGDLPLIQVDGFPASVAHALEKMPASVRTLSDLEKHIERNQSTIFADRTMPDCIYQTIVRLVGFDGFLATAARDAVMKHTQPGWTPKREPEEATA